MEQIKLLKRTLSAKKILIFIGSVLLMVSTVASGVAAGGQDSIIQEKRAVEKEQSERNAKADREKEMMFREMSPEEREAKMKAEYKARARRQLELVKMAKLTMEQAIQIASSQKSGTAMECSLIGERGTAYYRVTVVSGDENAPVSSLVFVNAVDGTIGDFPNAGYAVTTFNGKEFLTVRP